MQSFLNKSCFPAPYKTVLGVVIMDDNDDPGINYLELKPELKQILKDHDDAFRDATDKYGQLVSNVRDVLSDIAETAKKFGDVQENIEELERGDGAYLPWVEKKNRLSLNLRGFARSALAKNKPLESPIRLVKVDVERNINLGDIISGVRDNYVSKKNALNAQGKNINDQIGNAKIVLEDFYREQEKVIGDRVTYEKQKQDVEKKLRTAEKEIGNFNEKYKDKEFNATLRRQKLGLEQKLRGIKSVFLLGFCSIDQCGSFKKKHRKAVFFLNSPKLREWIKNLPKSIKILLFSKIEGLKACAMQRFYLLWKININLMPHNSRLKIKVSIDYIIQFRIPMPFL